MLSTLIFGRLHIYVCVCGFLKLASLSKLIFGRFFLKKKLASSICVCVCVCVCRSLKLACWTHWYLAGCIYKYACGFYIRYLAGLMEYICMWIFKVGKFEYIDIWQVLSQKKKKKLVGCWKYIWLLKIYVYGFICVENMTVGRMWIYIYWKYDR